MPSLLPLVLAAAPAYALEIAQAVAATREIYPVPPTLVRAVIRQESNFNPHAVSPAGAVGLMQVMPSTAPKVGVRAEYLATPALNVLAGVRLLAILLRYYRGDLISALVAYNARPRAPFAPLPRNGETPAYVAGVLRFYRHEAAADSLSRRSSP